MVLDIRPLTQEQRQAARRAARLAELYDPLVLDLHESISPITRSANILRL